MLIMCQLQTVIEKKNTTMFYKPRLVKFARTIQRFQPFVMLMFSKQKGYSFTQQLTPSISFSFTSDKEHQPTSLQQTIW